MPISRIAVRAILFGAVVELAGISLLLALLAAFAGDTSLLNADRIHAVGAGAHLAIGAIWIVGALAGGFVAARIGRSTSTGDGVLYGAVTWATACLTAGMLLCIWYMSAIKVGIVTPQLGEAIVRPTMLRAFFIHDLLALAAAISGALWATHVERNVDRRVADRIGHPIVEPR